MEKTETDAERRVRWDRQKPVIDLMLASSCFGHEVCKFPPCACAQSLMDRTDKMQAGLEKIANMFQEANFGSTLMKPNYGYYDVLKAAQAALKE